MAERAWFWLQWAFQDGSRNFHPLVQVTRKLIWILLFPVIMAKIVDQIKDTTVYHFRTPTVLSLTQTFRLPENHFNRVLGRRYNEATFSSKFYYTFCQIHLSVIFFMQNFKREEQNFVVQNEINNLSFLTGDSKTKMSKVGVLSDEFTKFFTEKQTKRHMMADWISTRTWMEMLKTMKMEQQLILLVLKWRHKRGLYLTLHCKNAFSTWLAVWTLAIYWCRNDKKILRNADADRGKWCLIHGSCL